MVDKKVLESWGKILNPDVLKKKIMCFSIYVTAFELLKNVIITKVEFFFVDPFSDDDAKKTYEENVLSLSKSKLYASLQWLKNIEAIDNEDLIKFDFFKGVRNDISHEMFDLLCSEPTFDISRELDSIISLLNKIELWWIYNLDMAIDPEFYPDEIEISSIQPMSVWTLKLIINVALGDENESREMFNEFQKKAEKAYSNVDD